MGYDYEKEKIFREVVEKLILFSDEIDDVYGLYQEIYDKIDTNEVSKLAENLSVFFENVKESYGVSLLNLDTETYIYQIDKHYKKDFVNITKVIERISAEDFEKLCALFLKKIVECEAVNATQRSHDQGIDFVGYKKYVKCLTTEEQNNNLLYVIGQAKHYQNQRVETSEIRELAGSIYLLRSNDFSKKKNSADEKAIYGNLEIDAFTPIVPYFITSNYFSGYAYVLCKNAAIIAIDRLSLVLNLVFSDMFDGMSQSKILKEIQAVKRIS